MYFFFHAATVVLLPYDGNLKKLRLKSTWFKPANLLLISATLKSTQLRGQNQFTVIVKVELMLP